MNFSLVISLTIWHIASVILILPSIEQTYILNRKERKIKCVQQSYKYLPSIWVLHEVIKNVDIQQCHQANLLLESTTSINIRTSGLAKSRFDDYSGRQVKKKRAHTFY
jgi:hypothetical protein